jgi:cyclopropane fatty-acyl-phospholipid synthase-like methyltransferase
MVWGAVKRWLPSTKFAVWSLKNPGGSFKQFYAENAVSSLARRKNHSSLGPSLKPGRLASARRTFDKFLTYGIRPNNIVVDYGCGTLRLGVLFIEFLDPDRYIGLDIDERILATGREQLAEDVVETKRPTLEVISEQSLKRVAARQPRWVCSKGVLQHVPPEELDDYFGSLAHLIHAGATGLLFSQVGRETKRTSPKTWVHNFDQLHAAAEEHGMELGRLNRSGTFMELNAANGA